MNLNKIPPHNFKAEQIILGVMIKKPENISLIFNSIKTRDFYIKSHRIIFEEIFSLYNMGETINFKNLQKKLKIKYKQEELGGRGYLKSILKSLPSDLNIEHYVESVLKKSLLRNILKIGSNLIELVYKEDFISLNYIADEAESLIFQLNRPEKLQDFADIGSVMTAYFKKLERIYHSKIRITGLHTGFRDFDLITNGLQDGELSILASSSGIGKTAFALNIAEEITMKQNLPVGLFSLNMNKEQIAERIIHSQAEIDIQKMKTEALQPYEWERIIDETLKFASVPLYIDDTPRLNILEMKSRSRRMKLEHNIKLLIIDYIQLIYPVNRIRRCEQITEMTIELKMLAKELEIPVLALAQLKNDLNYRTDKRPQIFDLPENMFQDSDNVFLLYRGDYYYPERYRTNLAEIIIAKQRNGYRGTVELFFIKEYAKFKELAL